jgi:hypothetical protein
MTNKLLIYHFESATFDSYPSKLIEDSSEELELPSASRRGVLDTYS